MITPELKTDVYSIFEAERFLGENRRNIEAALADIYPDTIEYFSICNHEVFFTTESFRVQIKADLIDVSTRNCGGSIPSISELQELKRKEQEAYNIATEIQEQLFTGEES